MSNKQQRKGPRKLSRMLALSASAALALTVSAGAAADDQTHTQAPSQEVQLLINSGALDLALDRINQIQPKVTDADEWLKWENLRYDLYRRRKDWSKLTERLLNLPATVPELERQDLMTHAAELLLASGNGEKVRKILRSLIWRGVGDSEQLKYWRRLVVRSYLVDKDTHDAEIAMSLYDREYLPQDSSWDYLYAQVLLREGKNEEAAQRLGSAQAPQERVLRLLARLRADVDSPKVVMSECAKLRKTLEKDSPVIPATWAVSAEAAVQASDPAARVEALEQLFNGPPLPPEFTLFHFEPADLWAAYKALGTQLGNARKLLMGDPKPWMALAKSLKGPGSALEARAINAAVALYSTAEPERGELHLALYHRLEEAKLTAVAIRLYESHKVFPSVADVPDSVRHQIVSIAIEQRDMKLAARFAEHLAAPSSDQTELEWDLVRARLALYAGDAEQSASILRALVVSHESFEPDEADRVMQPIFDLQSVGKGAVAFELLQDMYDRVTTAKQKREILYWLGDAKKSEGDDEAAAEYYLRSAFANSEPYDMWGQSARYSAAEALADAHLFDDAERI
ncbi:MAG: hypothetical protein WB783_10100, partial [Arenicellales bacterium]